LQEFLGPLQSQKILSQSELEKLFFNVKELFDLDSSFLRQMGERMKGWSPRQQVANLLYEHVNK